MENGQPKCLYPQYVNFEYGPIGKAASTKDNPNTAQYFNFWISAGVDTVTTLTPASSMPRMRSRPPHRTRP